MAVTQHDARESTPRFAHLRVLCNFIVAREWFQCVAGDIAAQRGPWPTWGYPLYEWSDDWSPIAERALCSQALSRLGRSSCRP